MPSPVCIAALPPAPVPADGTDAGVVKAIAVVVTYVEKVAAGFAGGPASPTLDAKAIYEELAAARAPRHLALVCERLSLACHAEAAAQSAAGQAAPKTAETLRGFAGGFSTMAGKYMDAAAAHLASQTKKGATSAVRLVLSYECASTEAQRALLNMHGGRDEMTEKLVASTRAFWRTCIEAIASDSKEPHTPTVAKLVEDILTVHACAQLLTRSDGGYWSTIAQELLEQELQLLCQAQSKDVALARMRLAKLLQTTAGTASQREDWRAQLKKLALTTAKPSTLTCLAPFTELLSMTEYAFVGQQLLESPSVVVAALTIAKQRALAVLLHAKQSLSADQYAAEQHRILGTYELACALLTQHAHVEYKACHDHCRHAMAHLNKVASYAHAQSSASPLQRFTTIINRMRLFYLWSAQAELRGAHVEAKYICNKAIDDAQSQFYSHLKCSVALAPPTSGLLAGHLYLARISAKLDLWPAVDATLASCDIVASAADEAVEQRLCSTATFLAANGVHTRQVRAWQRTIRSALAKHDDDVDALADDLAAINCEDAPLANLASSCHACTLFHAPAPTSAFLPCQIDTLLHALRRPTLDLSPAVASKSRAEKLTKKAAAEKKENEIVQLESLLTAHATMRHPPLMRALHHRLAQLHADEDETPVRAVYHLHQAMALSARNEQSTLLPQEDARVAPATDEEEFTSFQAQFLERLPATWTVCTIDVDVVTGQLLMSRATNKSHTHRSLSSDSLASLSSTLKLALKSADDASKMAGQYNADRAVRKAEPSASPAAASAKPKTKAALAKENAAALAEAKQQKAQVESLRVDANSGIESVCSGLQDWLGDNIDLLQGDGPIILILGSPVTHLPWENVPALAQQTMYRMNSWTFMRDQLPRSAAPLQPPRDAGYFVLNPQGNISAAEEFSTPLRALGWSGTVGSSSINAADWLAALQRPGYFVYVGHNGGEELVNPRDIAKSLKSGYGGGGGVRTVSLQMGCSSALQRYKECGPQPLYEADGLSLVYNQSGCPAMVGCLWNVPEDIDRWLSACLTSFTSFAGQRTLMQAAIDARAACNRRYLTAASVVCYGLPVQL